MTNRVDDLGKTDIIRPKCIGVDVDLVFFDKPADRGHLGNAVRPLQRIADVPVLDATDLVQIPAASWIALRVTAFERIPENLSQGGRIRSQSGRDIVRQYALWEAGKFLQHSGTGPVEINVIFENDIDGGVSKIGKAADGFDTGQSQEGDRQRIADLVLHITRRASRPLRKDNLLILANVRDGIDQDRVPREKIELPIKRGNHDAPRRNEDHGEGNDQLIFKTKADSGVHAELPLCLWTSMSMRTASPTAVGIHHAALALNLEVGINFERAA